MSFTKTWNESSPAGSDDAAQGDDVIRDFKYGVRERLAVDHYFLASEGSDTKIGFHKTVTLIDQTTPSAVADAIRLYSKVVGSASELHALNEGGTEYQLTLEQRLWIESLRIASQAQGDLITHNGTKWTRKAVGSNGQVPVSDGSDWDWGSVTTASEGYLYGLIVANNSSDATNDLDIGTGVARDDTDTYDIILGSALTKQGDAAFSAGSAAGGGDITGSAGIRYVYLIGKSGDSAAADVVFSSSAPGAVSLPSTWDIKRLIAVLYWDGSKWAKFDMRGNGVTKKVYLHAPITIVSGGTQTTFTDVDVSAYVPDGYCTAIECSTTYSGGAASGTVYARPNGSSAAVGSSTTVAAEKNDSNSSGGGFFHTVIDSSGIFEYAVSSSITASIFLRAYEVTL